MTFGPHAVQSLRQVGCRGGFPYVAWGVYEPRVRRDGVATYRLVASGRWCRGDQKRRHAFAGVPVREGVRHGTRVPGDLCAALCP